MILNDNNNIYIFLKKILDYEFLDYPDKIFAEVIEAYHKIFDDFIEDIKAKHLTYNDFTNEGIINLLFKDVNMEAIFYYRIANCIFNANPNSISLDFLSSLQRKRTSVEIYYSTQIKPGLNVQHGVGIVIGPRNIIGNNFTIHQGVTIGQRYPSKSNDTILIGDNVLISSGVKVIGNLTIGDNVLISENSVVRSDLKSNKTYIGSPRVRISGLGFKNNI